jgi:hypothetical protein
VTEAGLVSRIASLGVPTPGSFFPSIPLVYMKSPLSAIGSFLKQTIKSRETYMSMVKDGTYYERS